MEQALVNNFPEPGHRFRNSNLAQAWLVLVLAILFGAALAAIQVGLSEIILENKQNETFERVPELVWGPGGAQKLAAQKLEVEIIPGTLQVTSGSKSETFSLFKVTRDKQLAGWVIKASGPGYADKIELLIGVDPEVQALTGLFVLEQKETPGLGNKITSPAWRRQFAGQFTARPLAVVKGTSGGAGQTIDALTGATISSRSVTRIVNRVMAAVQGKLTPDTVRLSERRK